MEKNKSLLSVYGILKQTCEKYGNKEVIYDANERITYNQMKNDVDLFAGALTNKGIVKGDRVAAALPNWYETVVIFFAVAKIGAVLVPFNPKYKFHEVEYILNNSEPKLLIATEEFEKNVTFKKVLALVPEAITLRFSLTGFQRYEELIQEGSHSEEIPIDSADDLYCLLYTSGTTGMPKGVMLSHQSLIHSAVTIGGEIHGTNEDVFILSAPVFHIFGMGINLFCAVSLGARIVLLEKFQPRQVLHLIQQEKVTIHSGVPTMFIKGLEVDDFQSYDLSSLRTGIVGAAPIPANKVKEIRDRLGFNLLQSYGISETSSVTLTPYDDHEQFILETVGRAIPGVEMQIVDENRRPLQPGEIGEIAIKSISSMKGYYKMPEQTAAVLDSAGWYYTGDLGTLDSGGYLRFVGRKKEIIIRGGLNIYPQELEALLTKHPKVMDVAIVGIPDEVFGEIACAVVQLKDGSESTEEEIIEYLKRQIANYKLPNKVFFTKEFPVTPSGKIQKMRLREQIVSEMARPI